jgi:hypothetical protein
MAHVTEKYHLPEPSGNHFDMDNMDFPENEAPYCSSWTFMPALSQLETFPPNLDTTDVIF